MYNEYKKELLRSTIFLIMFTSIVSGIIAVFNFIIPIALSVFLKEFHDGSSVVKYIGILIVLYVVIYFAKILLNSILKEYGIKFKTREHMRLMDLIFQMKYEALIAYEPTYLVERITICSNTLYDVYVESISKIIVSGVSIFIALILIWKISPFIALILMLVMMVQLIGYKKVNQLLQDKCVKLQDRCAHCFKNIISITSKVEFVKQVGDRTRLQTILKPYIQSLHKENAIINKFAKDISNSLEGIMAILQGLLYLIAAILVIQEDISTIDFMIISMVSTLFSSGLRDLVNTNVNLRDVKGVNHFIEHDLMANKECEDGNELDYIHKIEFDIIDFGYKEKLLIKNGKFQVMKGEVILINGESGTGKTSLVRGLLKNLPIDTIRINGVNLHEISTKAIRTKIQFFSQDIPIITGTIKDNILLGSLDRIQIIDTIKEKKFMSKFCELPNGLETIILEGGSNLSGGDKQKIALARLFVEEPDVIILDESTNSIDEINAYEILTNIIEEFRELIIIIISHDSKVKSICDRIITIKDNEIIVENSHQ